MDTAHGTQEARTPLNKHQVVTDTGYTTHNAHTAVNKRPIAKDTTHTTHHARTLVNKWGKVARGGIARVFR